jgi:hypothetical protein
VCVRVSVFVCVIFVIALICCCHTLIVLESLMGMAPISGLQAHYTQETGVTTKCMETGNLYRLKVTLTRENLRFVTFTFITMYSACALICFLAEQQVYK